MKHQHLIPLALAVFITSTALHATAVENQLPVPQPDFMTSAQLTKWRAETTAKTVAAEQAQAASSPKTYATTGFYTGKPYLAESGSYAFKYREYNPEMSRWTTVDPSGFPDGANNRVYAAVPTSEFDYQGLARVLVKSGMVDSHSVNCYAWVKNMGDGNDWSAWYVTSMDFDYVRPTTSTPNATASSDPTALGKEFVSDLGLSNSPWYAKKFTAYSGIINWNVYKDVQGNKTDWYFDYTVKNLYSWDASRSRVREDPVYSNKQPFTPGMSTGELKSTVTTVAAE